MSNVEPKRVTINVSDDNLDDINYLKEAFDVSTTTDVIKKALSLSMYLTYLKEADHKTNIINGDGEIQDMGAMISPKFAKKIRKLSK